MAFLEDDDEAFKAALSFVDEFALDEEGAGGSSPSTQLPSAAVIVDPNELRERRRRQVNERRRSMRKAGVYADPNRVRNGERAEISRLREQLEQLQLDLQVLQEREATPAKESLRRRSDAPSVTTLASRAPSVWQELAMRQRSRRDEAERENIRLRLGVERQRKLAGTLSSLLRRRADLLTKDCVPLTRQPYLEHHVVNVLDVHGDMEDFRVLFQHLETAYRGLDAVFTANGLASSALSPSDVHLRESADGRYLECFSHKLLPFDICATTEAIWEHFKGVEKHFGNGSLYAKAANNLDEPYTIVEHFTKELYANTSRADIKVKQVVRRFVGADRDAVIWVARVAPAEIKHKLLRGLTYHLRGYAVTKRSPDSTPSQELSELQQCSLISLDHDASMKLTTTDLYALTNFLVVNSAQNIRAHRERIENILIDQAEDDGAFEAALSFLDEFATGACCQDAQVPETDDDSGPARDSAPPRTKRTRQDAGGRHELSGDDKERRRAEFNERRKLLRKAGVYGDANKARNERARAITALREEAGKLQIDLQILQTRQHTNDQRANMKEEDGKRQRKVANSLTRQMQRRAAQLTNECASLVTSAPSNQNSFHVLDFKGDLEGFRGLFRRLDNAYRNVDNVFMTNGLAGMTISPVDVHVRKGDDGKSLKFASYKVLPFDVRAAAEATWNHFKGVEKHLAYGNLYEKAEKGLDEPYTIIADFKKEVYSNSSRADIKVKQVIRRYVEEDRDIALWVSRAVPIEIKHKILQGLTYHLRGYAVTKRSSESSPDREVSVLQLCYLISLDQDIDVRCDAANLQGLINFLVVTTKQNILAHREQIENALIDRSLSHHK
ncbi:M96 mating-specific protein family [Phytophthora cinnamomi]|uniref:M96 mating-specific protein family n=1 Tax=Phytophthora cinnamomi TaxID=4785 RepID=UPI00355A1E63|nr:M96 mating-specific protein family [Phytophthora cinnamomi]